MNDVPGRDGGVIVKQSRVELQSLAIDTLYLYSTSVPFVPSPDVLSVTKEGSEVKQGASVHRPCSCRDRDGKGRSSL